jgi:hypothetical protein
MPSSRVANLLLSSALLLGTSAGVAAFTSADAPAEASAVSEGAGRVPNAAGRADAAAGRANAAAGRANAAAGRANAAARRANAAAKAASRAARSTTPATSESTAASSASSPSAPASSSAPSTSVDSAPAPGPSGGDGGLMWVGSVAGGYQQALAGTGVDLANHAYAFFSGGVPQAEMITVSAGGVKWRDVAHAAPGSTLHNQIVTWAKTIKARGTTVMLAYNHEPEAHDRLTLGSSQEFIAAWRHVRSIFDQQGATNIEWTWQMTAYSFRVKSTSEQAAATWYPGDEWVDNVGADAYNWIACGATGNGTYNSMKTLGDPVLAFARAHGKKASFPEFASHANAQRPQWLADAHDYFVANEDIISAAFYFNRPPTIASNADCKWGLTSSTEYAGLRAMAQDGAHFRV